MSAARRNSSHPDDSSPVLRRHAGDTMGQGGRLVLTEARSSAPRAFHVMAKPTGAVCNLDCQYCFFLAKESLYPGSDFRMSDDVLDALRPGPARRPSRGRRGRGRLPGRRADDDGTRLLPPGRSSSSRSTPQPGQRILNTLQTNATLLDDELGRASSPSTTSWSGCRSTVRASCTTRTASTRAASRPSTASSRGLDVLKRHGVEWNALTTVNAANAGPRPRGLPVPARRPRRPVHPAHPDRRAPR